MTTWNEVLVDVCHKVRGNRGHGTLTFADMMVGKKDFYEILDLIPSEVLFTGKTEVAHRDPRLNDEGPLIIDHNVGFVMPWIRFFEFKYRDEPASGWCIEIHIRRGYYSEIYGIEHFDGRSTNSPRVWSNLYIDEYMETGYDGHGGKSQTISTDAALRLIQRIADYALKEIEG